MRSKNTRTSPGFQKERLREAREARTVTVAELAGRCQLSRQAISQYENGVWTPSPEVLKRMASQLNLPEQYFFTPKTRSGPEEGASNLFFRSLKSSTKGSRIAAERRFFWLKESFQYLEEFVEFPKSNLPEIEIPENPRDIGLEEIEEIAVRVRAHWNLGLRPVGNLVRLLEQQGVVVVRQLLGSNALDAFSQFLPELKRGFVVLGGDKAVGCRSRFDAAHELAHLLLHRQLRTSELFDEIEAQAHRFAAAFLFPAPAFASEFFAPTLDSFRVLKSRWRVSISMLISRARQLGHISDQQERFLRIGYSRRGWIRKGEPLDDQIPPEQPTMLRDAVTMLFQNGIIQREDLLTHLPFSTEDIEGFLGLPDNYLNQPEHRLSKLIFFKSQGV